jgi:hypothetical protein
MSCAQLTVMIITVMRWNALVLAMSTGRSRRRWSLNMVRCVVHSENKRARRGGGQPAVELLNALDVHQPPQVLLHLRGSRGPWIWIWILVYCVMCPSGHILTLLTTKRIAR